GVARLGIDHVLARATASAAAAPAAAARRAAVDAGRRAAARTAGQLRRRTGGRTDAHRLPRVQVVARRVAVLRFAVDDAWRIDVDRRVEAVTAADAEPIHVGDAAAPTLRARAAPRIVVLQPGVHVVRMLVVGGNDVGEPGRHRGDEVPRAALIPADVETAVVADHEVVRVPRIDEDRVLIDVRRRVVAAGFVERSEGL